MKTDRQPPVTVTEVRFDLEVESLRSFRRYHPIGCRMLQQAFQALTRRSMKHNLDWTRGSMEFPGAIQCFSSGCLPSSRKQIKSMRTVQCGRMIRSTDDRPHVPVLLDYRGATGGQDQRPIGRCFLGIYERNTESTRPTGNHPS